jgi:ribonuclease Y
MDLVAVGGIAIGAVVAFWVGYMLRSRIGSSRARSAEQQAASMVDQARREAESLKRNATLEGREESLHLKQQVERELAEHRKDQLAAERAFQEKEAAFNRRVELVDKMDRDLKRQDTDLQRRESEVQARHTELERLIAAQTAQLERVAGLTVQDARNQLIASIEC